MTSCILVERNRSFEGTYCLHPYGRYRCLFTIQQDVTANKKWNVIVITLRISGPILLVSHTYVSVKNCENPRCVHISTRVFTYVLKAVRWSFKSCEFWRRVTRLLVADAAKGRRGIPFSENADIAIIRGVGNFLFNCTAPHARRLESASRDFPRCCTYFSVPYISQRSLTFFPL
jgi:hypothetical protein